MKSGFVLADFFPLCQVDMLPLVTEGRWMLEVRRVIGRADDFEKTGSKAGVSPRRAMRSGYRRLSSCRLEKSAFQSRSKTSLNHAPGLNSLFAELSGVREEAPSMTMIVENERSYLFHTITVLQLPEHQNDSQSMDK